MFIFIIIIVIIIIIIINLIVFILFYFIFFKHLKKLLNFRGRQFFLLKWNDLYSNKFFFLVKLTLSLS